jgi:hypothetical protein
MYKLLGNSFRVYRKFVALKNLKKFLDPDYCNWEVQRLILKVRRVRNMRKLGGYF